MAHIKGKYSLNKEHLWIGNPKNEEEGMQIFNNQLTAWVRALQHAKNPAITLNHRPDTKEFKWIKHQVPMLDSLSGPMASLTWSRLLLRLTLHPTYQPPCQLK
jgi:hypothetical protein